MTPTERAKLEQIRRRLEGARTMEMSHPVSALLAVIWDELDALIRESEVVVVFAPRGGGKLDRFRSAIHPDSGGIQCPDPPDLLATHYQAAKRLEEQMQCEPPDVDPSLRGDYTGDH